MNPFDDEILDGTPGDYFIMGLIVGLVMMTIIAGAAILTLPLR